MNGMRECMSTRLPAAAWPLLAPVAPRLTGEVSRESGQCPVPTLQASAGVSESQSCFEDFLSLSNVTGTVVGLDHVILETLCLFGVKSSCYESFIRGAK